MARSAIYILIFAIVVAWFYDRWPAIQDILQNRPGKFTSVNSFKSHEVLFKDELRNCEDVILDEEKGIAFLSCDSGRDRWNTVMGTFKRLPNDPLGKIFLYNYADPSSSSLKPLLLKNFPNENEFHPLGIEWDPTTSTLYTVSHAHSAPVLEIFTVSLSTSTATHIRTLSHPFLHAPNSIHSLGSGKLFITNDHYFPARHYPLLSKLELWLNPPLASIAYLKLNSENSVREARVVARLPFANGVVMLNSSTLAVASSSRPAVYLYKVTMWYDLEFQREIRVPAAVDNLSVDKRGRLLMAGHPFALSLIGVAKRRAECFVDGKGDEINASGEGEESKAKEACVCDAPSWVAEWSEEGGLRELYKDDGTEFCSSSTVVRDEEKGVGIVSGLYERGVLVFRNK